MRDFRDAKAMAHSLRQALAARAAPVTHSEALELTAKAFGLDNWNVLAAKIAAAGPLPAPDPAGPTTRYCSFCGKPQQEVAYLIAGPEALICNECVQICDDVIDDQSIAKLEREAKARDPDADADAILRSHLAGMTPEALSAHKLRTERWLHHIRWSLDEIAAAEGGGARRHPKPLRDPLAGLTPQQIAAKRRELEARREEVQRRLTLAEQLLDERLG
jgi:hypothetical protein